MKFREFEFTSTEQISEMYLSSTNTESHILQLSPAPFRTYVKQVELRQGCLIELERFESRLRSREVQRDEGLVFSSLLSNSLPMNSRGLSISPDMAMVYQRTRIDYIAHPGVKLLTLALEPDCVRRMGWDLDNHLIRKISRQHLSELQQACMQLFAQQQQASVQADEGCGEYLERLWTDRILSLLAKVLQPWMHATEPTLPPRSGAHYFELIDDVERWYLQGNLSNAPAVPDISREIGVPLRSLYHSFRVALGMGPHQYLTIIRLHLLRKKLLAAEPANKTVTELASSLGFEQLGRLSGLYRRYFAENPSDTLAQTVQEGTSL